MTATTSDWRTGLTEAQQATVEKVARAYWANNFAKAPNMDFDDYAARYGAELEYSNALAALRAAYPSDWQVKAKTPGEAVAEKLFHAKDGIVWCSKPDSGSLDYSFPAPERNQFQAAMIVDNLRRSTQQVIDAARASAAAGARAAALEDAARKLERNGYRDCAELIRGLAGKGGGR